MAEFLVSLPDDLLTRVDAEAHHRGISRDVLLHQAALHELGDPVPSQDEIFERLLRVAGGWPQHVDVVGELRADRQRPAGG